ncbi:MAG: M48 family metallopeptidase [Planctomycetes bacterium]|nr:M48 family metallopeptidase [Planctomycetota bacterium]
MLKRLSTAVRWSLALLALWLLPACITEPITGRRVLAPIIPESTANEMGVQAYQQMLSEATLSSDRGQTDVVERAGRRIAAVTDQHLAEDGRELYQWEFKLIDDPKMVNAFCLPGGKVAFYTGILPICKDELGVAVVMGHEVGHAYAEHGRRRVSEQVLAQFSLEAVQLALGGEEASEASRLAIAALGVGYQVGVQLPFSRADESAADEIGLMLMAEAGYDPSEAVAFWQRMDQAGGGGGPPEFLSTHPSHETRIQRLQELLPKAQAAYARSRGGAGAPGAAAAPAAPARKK